MGASAYSKASGESGQRRNTVDIYADILEVVKRHGGHGRVTRISYGVGMPVDRLKKFLERLERYGLVVCERDSDSLTYLLTHRGQEFIDTYWTMKGFLEALREVAQ
ncbi:MAG: winged helix-turn-helix domain-containing protein [Nitrososphaerales archaeon]